MRAWWLVTLLLLAPLSGCLGGGDADNAEPLRKARAEVGDDLGGIEGLVTDEAFQPITGANVTIAELGERTRTQQDGSFAFSKLAPGTYTLAVQADGFVSASQTVVVAAREVAVAEFLLAHLAVEEAFTQAWEFAGFFECGLSVVVYSTRPCRDVSSALGGNATNDRSDHRWMLEGPIQDLIFESVWDAGAADMGKELWIDVVVDPFHCPNYCNWTYFDTVGASPLYIHVNDTRFDEIDAWFQEQCRSGEDQYCNFDFRDKGWPMWSRVYPYFNCLPEGLGCAPFQLDYTHYVTAFYNAGAPDGYSVLAR